MMEEKADGKNGLSLCVINYNGESYLEESIGAALVFEDQFDEILLVDNASTDRSREIVREKFPSVRIVGQAENRGAAAARNAGFEAAAGGRVLFIDNDVILTAGCAVRLVETLDDNPGATVAMPRVLYADNREVVQFGGAGAHWLGLMIVEDEDRPAADCGTETRLIDSVVTACFLVDRGRWGVGDLFDESFFIYLEDHDFGLRARIRGGEILFVPAAECLHRAGTEGLSLRRIGHYASRRVFCLIRNRWQVIAKNYSLRTLLLLAPAFVIYELSQFFLVLKKGWLREWGSAAWWMTKNSGAVLRKRGEVRRGRRTPDREILSGGPIPFRRELTESGLEKTSKNALNGLLGGYWRLISRLV